MLVFSSRRSPREATAKRRQIQSYDRFWRSRTYPNGQPVYDPDGTMLDDDGKRSIFDDLDC